MNYTVRVELHNASWDDYETLHAEMENRGFARTITGNNGVTYQLPTAEYNASSQMDAVGVREVASEAAKATGRKYAVLVTVAGQRAWVGLQSA